MKKRIVINILIIVAVTLPAMSVVVAKGELLPYQGKICFQSYRDGNWEVYTMKADGSAQTNLTNNFASDWTCRWSPDGRRIAFISFRDNSQGEVYVMNADGSQPTRLTNNSAWEYYPNWSPDGSKIVFSSDTDGDHEIYIMNRDGSGVVQLTFNTSYDSCPAWSPDNSKIIFQSYRDLNYEIYRIKPDGSEEARLTYTPAGEIYANWSPDSTWIVYYSGTDIWKMLADGTGAVQLTSDTVDNWSPVFSPDGATIAFSSLRDGNEEVYAMDADGSDQTNLTNNSSYDRYPHWNGFTSYLFVPVAMK